MRTRKAATRCVFAATAMSAAALACANAALAADGAAIFEANCAACHQTGGVGAPGLAPPLVSKHIAAAAQKKPDYAVLVVLNGLSGPLPLDDGGTMTGIMPPQGPTLSDDDIAAVLTYVFEALNGAKVSLDAKAIAELRTKTPTAHDLRAMREGLQQ